ncbi:MAG: ACP S-malonyltransferase [Defluviitaleaceae bacterium]|nr:ACP S-malonyltransferase [Defluviitaleaceae bacterium]
MNKISILFSGQGSQYEGMGKKWILEHKGIKDRIKQASDLLDLDLLNLCINGTNDELQKTEISQPAIFALSYAMFEQFCSTYQPNVSHLAGHSLGEITALAAAGVLTYEDGLKFVHARGEAMSACCKQNPSAMTAVTNVDATILNALMEEYEADKKGIFIANYNTPCQTVLSGGAKELAEFTKQIKGTANCIPLKVAGGFHSAYMADAVTELKGVLDEISINKGEIPVVNGNQKRFYREDDDVRQLLLDQIIKPVNWNQSLELLEDQGTKLWIEFGPKNVLKNTVRNSIFNPKVFSYDTDDIADLLEELKIVETRNSQIPNLIGLCLGVAVSTKNNCQDEQLYKKNVVDSYNEIRNIHDQVHSENRVPTQQEEETALGLLELIMDTKQISASEQNARISQIIAMAASTKKQAC